MKIELSNFTIEYDKEIDYMSNIISTLENNTIEILEFFELEKLSQKKKVVIFTDREKYKKHLLPFVKEFKEWMCADTYDGNINLLEMSEARKSKEHEDMDMDEFIEGAGYENDFSSGRLHHEIYLSDARRAAPERWRTVIRHPVKLR